VKPALVVLAAGGSERLGDCKALVAITPRTPLELLLENGSLLDDVPALVVSGAHHARIQRAVPPGVAVAHNTRWSAGRTGSVQLAVRLRAGLDLCLAPVDVPLVPRAVFEILSRVWNENGSPARGWLAPECASRFGHPIVVGRALLEELARFPPDQPLNELRARAAPLFAAPVQNPEVLDDLDSTADLSRMRARFSH
jgi:CTP:molybdopterin cytidylyltransferase MocA